MSSKTVRAGATGAATRKRGHESVARTAPNRPKFAPSSLSEAAAALLTLEGQISWDQVKGSWAYKQPAWLRLVSSYQEDSGAAPLVGALQQVYTHLKLGAVADWLTSSASQFKAHLASAKDTADVSAAIGALEAAVAHRAAPAWLASATPLPSTCLDSVLHRAADQSNASASAAKTEKAAPALLVKSEMAPPPPAPPPKPTPAVSSKAAGKRKASAAPQAEAPAAAAPSLSAKAAGKRRMVYPATKLPTAAGLSRAQREAPPQELELFDPARVVKQEEEDLPVEVEEEEEEEAEAAAARGGFVPLSLSRPRRSSAAAPVYSGLDAAEDAADEEDEVGAPSHMAFGGPACVRKGQQQQQQQQQ